MKSHEATWRVSLVVFITNALDRRLISELSFSAINSDIFADRLFINIVTRPIVRHSQYASKRFPKARSCLLTAFCRRVAGVSCQLYCLQHTIRKPYSRSTGGIVKGKIKAISSDIPQLPSVNIKLLTVDLNIYWPLTQKSTGRYYF